MQEFYKRTWAQVNLDALEHNLSEIRGLCGSVRIIAVVKADAYGHGAPIVARTFSRCGVDFFAVSGIDEAQQLRMSGIGGDILILGYTPCEYVPELIRLGITQAVFDSDYAGELSRAARVCDEKLKVHIKVDTGMSRIGFFYQSPSDSVIDEIAAVYSDKNFSVGGIFSHFYQSELGPEHGTRRQFELFCDCTEKLKSRGINAGIRHIANSGAILNHPGTFLDAVRPGIILYGMYPDTSLYGKSGLIPAMSLKTKIAQIKKLPKGAAISYNGTYRADAPAITATLPIGYADGYSRNLSDRSYVYINGRRAPIRGRICMDQCIADITGIDASRGDEVELFGGHIGIDELASKAGTINYELSCSVGKRVPRIYLKNGREIEVFSYIVD